MMEGPSALTFFLVGLDTFHLPLILLAVILSGGSRG